MLRATTLLLLLSLTSCEQPARVTAGFAGVPVPAIAPAAPWTYARYRSARPDGPLSVHLSPALPGCRAGAGPSLRASGAPYQLLGLWRLEPPPGNAIAGGSWRLVHGQAAPARIDCERPRPFAELAGTAPLTPGTYLVLAEILGRLEPEYLYVGPTVCQDVHLGPAPEGLIPLCVLHATGAGARFVPDPLCDAVRGRATRVGTSIQAAGHAPPADLREAICLARRLAPWRSTLTGAGQAGGRYTISLQEAVVRPSIGSATVTLDPALDRLDVRLLGGD
jgi:hypothetical protein